MPFMKRFLPGSSNEKHFAVFYLIWMPQGDWWEVCSSEASLAHDPETLRSGFGFSQTRLLVTHKLVSCFQMRERDRGKLVGRQSGAAFIPAPQIALVKSEMLLVGFGHAVPPCSAVNPSLEAGNKGASLPHADQSRVLGG